MQLHQLKRSIFRLQSIHGDPFLCPIYGAGSIYNTRIMFVFMNPTSRNVSAHRVWRGLRAPWLGTKHVWNIFYELGIVSSDLFLTIQNLKSSEWTPHFSRMVYEEVAQHGVYVTNLAKCTQVDARPLRNHVFRDYLDIMRRELLLLQPRVVITFGNQVSSVLLGRNITVSLYRAAEGEAIEVQGSRFCVYPVFYPVGQGMRNMSHAIKRIREIIRHVVQ